VIFVAANYHYVARSLPERPRAIFPVAMPAFVAQLEELGRAFEFVSRHDVLAAVRGERSLPERSCLVTFDDGLRAQFELALPALEQLDIPALFLVPGRPLAERRALYVHKVHFVREQLGDEELLALLEEWTEDVSSEEAAAQYGYDTPEAARVKYLLNMALPLDEREAAIAAIFDKLATDEASFCDELYMSSDQVAELERSYQAVGSHGYAHEPLALLAEQALRSDLEHGAAVLEAATGTRPLAISYPHGSRAAVSPEVAAAAARAGFVVGFTMERAFNRTLEQPLLLARVDVNDAPGGSRPLFEIGQDEPSVRAGMTPARERYLAEAAQLPG
jgi:peptidoglycan/xylan/chitin deacetylase (PgdA/CDA1 family)